MLERSKLAVQNRIDPATTFANGSVSGSKSDSVDAVGTKTSALPRTQEECPVHMQRLMELSDDDPEQLRELVSLFLAQSEDLIKKLGAAIQSGSAKELTELAHNYGGDLCQLWDDSYCGSAAEIRAHGAVRPVELS